LQFVSTISHPHRSQVKTRFFGVGDGATEVTTTFAKPTFVGWSSVRAGGLCICWGDFCEASLWDNR